MRVGPVKAVTTGTNSTLHVESLIFPDIAAAAAAILREIYIFKLLISMREFSWTKGDETLK